MGWEYDTDRAGWTWAEWHSLGAWEIWEHGNDMGCTACEVGILLPLTMLLMFHSQITYESITLTLGPRLDESLSMTTSWIMMLTHSSRNGGLRAAFHWGILWQGNISLQCMGLRITPVYLFRHPGEPGSKIHALLLRPLPESSVHIDEPAQWPYTMDITVIRWSWARATPLARHCSMKCAEPEVQLIESDVAKHRLIFSHFVQ